ncbi:MAG: DUF2812 domain-containing protein [Erysipelotrichaceae bacterium]|nr:DUF2812 domain-containing protein [Erysipelotrichaceae bacterium]
MKTKYKLINYNMFDEDNWTEMFEKEASKGWMLDKAGLFFFKFKKSQPRKLKFFVDYNPAYEDYVDLTSKFGYAYIDNFESFSFWYSEDDSAEALQSDPVAKAVALKELYNTPSIVMTILIGLLLIIISDPFGITMNAVRYDLGGAILYKEFLVMFLLMNCLGMSMLLSGGAKIFTRIRYSREAEGLETPTIFFYMIKYLYYFFRVSALILFVPVLISAVLSVEPLRLLIIFILLIFNLLFGRTYSKKIFITSNIKNRKKYMISWMMFIILMLAIANVYPLESPGKDFAVTSLSVQKAFTNDANYYETIFYDEFEYYGSAQGQDFGEFYDYSYVERLYDCKNDYIANAIFEYQIEEIEHDSRIPTVEELDARIEAFDPYRDVEYKSYEVAIVSMTSVESDKIESGYYIGDRYLMKKGNVILYVLLSDGYNIQEILNAYF